MSLVDREESLSCDAFVEVVERNGWDGFGFLLYRIDHTNDEQWQQWNAKFIERVDHSMEMSKGGERLIDDCLIPISDEPIVNLDSFSEAHALANRFYREVSKPSGGVTAGLDHGICLAADGEVIKSLLEPEDGVEPWVWVVDEHYDFTQIDTITDDEYPGHFPVAISSLIPDLFPLVATGRSGQEVWACCSFDEIHPVWTSAVETP